MTSKKRKSDSETKLYWVEDSGLWKSKIRLTNKEVKLYRKKYMVTEIS